MKKPRCEARFFSFYCLFLYILEELDNLDILDVLENPNYLKGSVLLRWLPGSLFLLH